ncbi:hypothetical protein AMTRI_Chr07g28800 [Amborella trichopoda]
MMPVDAGDKPRGGRGRMVRCCALALLAVVVALGISVLTVWLIIRPATLTYSLESASAQRFGLKHDRLNSSFDFVMRADNPNKRVSVYYDTLEVSVSFEGHTIAWGTISGFFQPQRNETEIRMQAGGEGVWVQDGTGRDLRLEKRSGQVELEVNVRGKVQFKVGKWKSRNYKLRVSCMSTVPVVASKAFQGSECNVDI